MIIPKNHHLGSMSNEYKNATSNHERKLLALIDKYSKMLNFGKIQVEITIQNNKITLVEIGSVKESLKLQ